jgi:hypothetical protein
MHKFKIGDKVKRISRFSNFGFTFEKGKVYTVSYVSINGDISIEETSGAWWADNFELHTNKEQRHPHHDMIVEWAKDTSKVVEYKDMFGMWKRVLGNAPSWTSDVQYRFKPAERVFPKSSLTDDELTAIVVELDDNRTIKEFRAIADAAVKKYILEQEHILDTENIA